MTHENGTGVSALAAHGGPQGAVAGIDSIDLPLARIYYQERHNAACPLFTQPILGDARDWDWQAAVRDARRIAAYLRGQNWPPGSRIAILSKNCVWWILADFAVWMAGHTSVPIYPSLGGAALASILRHSQPVACFVGLLDQPPSLTESPLGELPRITFPGAPSCGAALSWADILQEYAPITDDPVRRADDIATIIYTSGTMGEPKGVMQSFLSLALMAKSMDGALAGGPPSDRILSYLPLAHVAERAIVEMNCLYRPLHVFFTEGQQTFLADLCRAKATIFFTVPRLLMRFQQGVHEKLPERKLSMLLRLPGVGRLLRKRILAKLCLDHVRLAASGSAPLAVDLLEWYRSLGLNLIEGYGMTETGITHATLPGKFRAGYVGDASPYATTRISAEGEVQIQGPMNLSGYFRNPSLMQESFTEDGYFRTGDRGELDALGRLRIIGRIKEEFKTSKGKYVFPALIENELAHCGLFESVCVLGSGMAGPFVVAVLTPPVRNSAQEPDGRLRLSQELEQELERVNQKLDSHEKLRFLVVTLEPWSIENGFLTPTMKVRRNEVETLYGPSFNIWEESGKTVIWHQA
jgi:long-chain acyl-CoA synthetase